MCPRSSKRCVSAAARCRYALPIAASVPVQMGSCNHMMSHSIDVILRQEPVAQPPLMSRGGLRAPGQRSCRLAMFAHSGRACNAAVKNDVYVFTGTKQSRGI